MYDILKESAYFLDENVWQQIHIPDERDDTIDARTTLRQSNQETEKPYI